MKQLSQNNKNDLSGLDLFLFLCAVLYYLVKSEITIFAKIIVSYVGENWEFATGSK